MNVKTVPELVELEGFLKKLMPQRVDDPLRRVAIRFETQRPPSPFPSEFFEIYSSLNP